MEVAPRLRNVSHHAHHHHHHSPPVDPHSAPSAGSVICYAPSMISSDGIYGAYMSPLDYALPVFLFQIIIVVLTTRLMVFLLRPFRQPRVISEIISGIVLGPSVMGRVQLFPAIMFPPRSILSLETVANLGLVFFLFLVGVEMDVNVIRRTGRKAVVIALVGMTVPFSIGTSTSFLFRRYISKNVHPAAFLLFLGVALAVTAFPVLARILAETKLLSSELGRTAMSAAIVNDSCAWILLALSIALANTRETVLASLWVLLSGIAFVLACFYAVRPAMWRLSRHIPDGEGPSDFQICCLLAGAMLASFVTDAIGIHSVFGAFMFGLVIPAGALGISLVEKLEDFVTGVLVPLFFVISGLKTDVSKLQDPITVALLTLVFVLASAGKIAATALIAVFYAIPINEGVALGFLMNSKGIIEMIVLNVGRDKQVLDDESFAVMVLVSLAMTALVTPVVTATACRSSGSRIRAGYKGRNLQRWSAKPDSELRMLACVYHARHVPSVVALLEASHPTKRSPVFVYALHLIELTGRASAMLIAGNGGSSRAGARGQREHILTAFNKYEQRAAGVSVQTLTAVSPFLTMHDDICGIAADKHAALIVLPFHKQITVDGGMEPTNPAIRGVNERVFASAPCSVALLVDRGLSVATQATDKSNSHHVAVLFFGGPDDREALAFAGRMLENPGTTLGIVRFLGPSAAAAPLASPQVVAARVITIVSDGASREQHLDEEYLSEFRVRHINNESVMYMETAVRTSEETVAALRSMDNEYDLYVVGREQAGEAAPMTAALSEFSECPELGPIGDLLASADFASTASVLVVKQFVSAELESPRARLVAPPPPQQQNIGVAGTQPNYQGWNGQY